ncbi:MAG: hypothetical protein E6J62_05040 [Deltaproteobacteria bacterium]|nr:MAG: hypothetical protein E6J85_08290 [Deltaproteobacteria bacterium]TMB33775.1 MAG: hypothetical protein E6J61_04965 [Deltaproteobacteria bacterium]TMB37489.1 MAG: hypothetical protein E6J62_05040 [Deltaproteobacteria bacterium]
MNTDELFSILRSHRERHPADGEAFDRVGALLGLPPLHSNGSAALDKALNLTASTPPPLSLPLRIKAAKASTLGWSADLYALTILVSNVSLRQEDGALLPRAGEPIVAVCAEYDRPLASLDPPELGRHSLASARTEGVPTLRLPAGGFFRSPIRLETTTSSARAPVGRIDALARAERFLDDLDVAWKQRIGSVLEISWPVYRSDREGPLLDAVSGTPLPPLQLR